MNPTCQALPRAAVRLSDSLFLHRSRLNRAYVASLQPDNLLQNFYLEAGLRQWTHRNRLHGDATDGAGRHWGWESPSCQVRGQFMGHWLSAAAQIIAAGGDAELKLRLEHVLGELEACQRKHGGEWLAATPEKYLTWLAQGQPTWATQYPHHKTLMGLTDVARFCDSDRALGMAQRFADWFWRWSAPFSREELDNLLDVETGGMLEAWADLYGLTGERKYLDLIERYTRHRLFDALLAGRDPLTNMHANTTIPEVHGAARCYEVTGESRWRQIVEAYWQCAVTGRGTFCTGGQTSGEIWCPPFEFAARRGDKNQEHCTVYNLIRLADYLFRWTGEAGYADYIERNLYNGILAQQHPQTGLIAYFLPLQAGARKLWGSPTHDFWCCHGTLVQAHARHNALIAWRDADGLRLAQYIPADIEADLDGVKATLRLRWEARNGSTQSLTGGAASWTGVAHRPSSWLVRVSVRCAEPTAWTLRLRLPEWLTAPARVHVNGEHLGGETGEAGWFAIERVWSDDQVMLELPKAVTAAPIPDEPGTMAFLDGPVVLAGLCDHELTLSGDPAGLLVPDNEREWGNWLSGWRTVGQACNVRFKPLHEVVDEPFTLYFPVRS